MIERAARTADHEHRAACVRRGVDRGVEPLEHRRAQGVLRRGTVDQRARHRAADVEDDIAHPSPRHARRTMTPAFSRS